MNEREMLEMAAKAARYPVRGIAAKMVAYLPDDAPHLVIGNDRGGDSVWNPLTNDGDALRLAVTLCMFVEFSKGWQRATAYGQSLDIREDIAESDPLSAARRAIVRAAAEVGKTMRT